MILDVQVGTAVEKQKSAEKRITKPQKELLVTSCKFKLQLLVTISVGCWSVLSGQLPHN